MAHTSRFPSGVVAQILGANYATNFDAISAFDNFTGFGAKNKTARLRITGTSIGKAGPAGTLINEPRITFDVEVWTPWGGATAPASTGLFDIIGYIDYLVLGSMSLINIEAANVLDTFFPMKASILTSEPIQYGTTRDPMHRIFHCEAIYKAPF